MNNIIELNGLMGVKDEKVFAYLSIEPEKVRKALEIEIACTGADDNGPIISTSMMKKAFVVSICNVVLQRSLRRWKR